jgi:PAS domain S-box-containing protein
MEPPLSCAILEHAPDAVIFVDSDEIIRFWNRRAAEVFGHTDSEALGQPLELIIPEPLRPAHHAGFRRAVDSGQTRLGGKALTTRAVHKDGHALYLEIAFGLVPGTDGRICGVVAIGRDITASHLASRGRNEVAGR